MEKMFQTTNPMIVLLKSFGPRLAWDSHEVLGSFPKDLQGWSRNEQVALIPSTQKILKNVPGIWVCNNP